jgi:hypothetical protein
MKRIFHGGGSMLTGTDLADAVLEYARMIGQRHSVELVEIPVVDEQGSTQRAQLLVGEGNPLVSVTSASSGSELSEPETAQRLRAQARGSGIVRAVPLTEDENENSSDIDWLEY